MQDVYKKSVLKIYAVVLGLGLSYFLFSKITGFTLPCIFFTLTGYECAGCGLTRMFFALSRFDIPLAFSLNPFMFVQIIIWNAVAVLVFAGKPRAFRNKKLLYALLFVSVGVGIVFTFLRNFT